MGKAMKIKKKKAAGAGNVHPLIRQADIPAAQFARQRYEVVRVPNPHGEVIVRGEVRQHKAVRIKPAFKEMYERRAFEKARIGDKPVPSKQIMAALEWYDARLDLAQSGMIKCGLDISGAAGGSAGAGIPTSQAAMEARSEVAWVRAIVPVHLLTAFDAVMVEGERFAETARRLHANRYIRTSVERARRILSAEFIQAAAIFAEAWAERFAAKNTGRILS